MDLTTNEQPPEEDELVWLNTQLPSSLKSHARIRAAIENIPMSELVRRAIAQYLGLPSPESSPEMENAQC